MMPAIDSFLTAWSPRVLSILRIIVGLLFLQHGTSKYLSLPVLPSTGVDPMSLSGINGMIELVGGVLIVVGLFTRPVAFILAGDMAVACIPIGRNEDGVARNRGRHEHGKGRQACDHLYL
jgi:uncharacterized membrane protein YphA (DoxX/SURF4 family)